MWHGLMCLQFTAYFCAAFVLFSLVNVLSEIYTNFGHSSICLVIVGIVIPAIITNNYNKEYHC